MRKKIAALFLVFVLLLVLAGCTVQSPTSPAQTGNPVNPNPTPVSPVAASPTSSTVMDVVPLSGLLQVVPADNIRYLAYNDIPVLSAYQGQAIPSRQASPREKVDWWTTFQREVLSGTSFPTVSDIWGFDAVDLQGSLTVWYQDQSSVNIASGHLDIPTFREKLKSYQYQEESYLGYPVFSGIPPSTVDVKPPLPNFFPLSFGIIEDVEISGDKISLIVLVNKSSDTDVLKAKNVIQSVLKAYQDKTTLAYRSGGITALANSLGRVGSVFITEDFMPQTDLQSMPVEEREMYTGPGKLSSYDRLAFTYRKDGNDPILEFILAYETNAIAESNADTLHQRLSEGRSITRKPVSEFWTVKEVKTAGQYLIGTVKLIEQTNGRTISFTSMVFGLDYLFLAPN